jgi:hypothetical protein
MTSRFLTGFALLGLGFGMAMNAVLGPLVLGVIKSRVSSNMENQLVGGEVASLFVAAPLAVAAGILWLRKHPLAPALALGPALYAVYMYVQFVAGPEYHRYAGNNEYFFPLYLALVILGWAITVRAWTALDDTPLSPPPLVLQRTLAGFLLILSVIFALAWTMSIMDVLNGGVTMSAYAEDMSLFWLIRLMDLGFVIPAALITSLGLFTRAPWAMKLSYAVTAVQTLLVSAVAGMAIVMTMRRDPSADSVLLVVTVVFTIALAVVYLLMLRSALRTAAPVTAVKERGPRLVA